MNTLFNYLFVFFLILTLIACDRLKSNPPSSSKSERTSSPVSPPELLQSQPEPVKSSSLSLESDRPSMRGPKQRYPELVTQPDRPNPIKDKINKAIVNADGNVSKLSANFTQLWNDGIARLPNTPLPSSKDSEIADGTRLPNEMETVLREVRFGTGEDTAEELIRGVAIWSALMCNDILTDFAKQRGNTLPPTKADIAIYESLNAGIRQFTQTRGQSSYVSFEKWEPFATAANPIYRLLALKAASLAVTKPAWEVNIDSKEFNQINGTPKMAFYLSYLDEKDPVILATAIRGLALVPLPEAREAIEKFRTEQLQKGDKALIETAEDALRTHKAILPESR